MRTLSFRSPALGALFASLALLCCPVPLLHAQTFDANIDAAEESQGEPIAAVPPEFTEGQTSDAAALAEEQARADTLMSERLRGIYDQIDGLNGVTVEVQDGLIQLGGQAANEEQAAQAIALAERIEGNVLVVDNIERLRDLEGNISPVVQQFSDDLDAIIVALPLIGFAFALFLIIAFLGHLLARWSSLWRRILPNVFLAELVAQAVRIIAIVAGLVMALNLAGANALMGTILGGAGVVGLAIGFAVRDTLENYVSSIMLSLRQPFRANEHVVIDDREGIVVRLTSRATILMTMDGNHLRIPNSAVFKAIILNYSRNPERRFEFALGVDAADDPAKGMDVGLQALHALPFLLDEPEPVAAIEEVGDSNIVLRFYAWVNQDEADFLKSRSLAIRAAKVALEDAGFTLPEPIYRLRFDQATALPLPEGASITVDDASDGQAARSTPPASPAPSSAAAPAAAFDTAPDQQIAQKVAAERAEGGEDDLLDTDRPVE